MIFDEVFRVTGGRGKEGLEQCAAEFVFEAREILLKTFSVP
jgi:hypothetical protein